MNYKTYLFSYLFSISYVPCIDKIKRYSETFQEIIGLGFLSVTLILGATQMARHPVANIFRNALVTIICKNYRQYNKRGYSRINS